MSVSCPSVAPLCISSPTIAGDVGVSAGERPQWWMVPLLLLSTVAMLVAIM